MSSNMKLEQKYAKQKAFEKIKFIVDCNNLLDYTDLNKPFDIQTDDISFHFGAVIVIIQ